jgi:hypothetical protein
MTILLLSCSWGIVFMRDALQLRRCGAGGENGPVSLFEASHPLRGPFLQGNSSCPTVACRFVLYLEFMF